jgi:hypothetical protein
MAPLRGWSPRGTRLKGAAPFGHWQTTTFLALRHDRVEAPWLLDGPTNGARFQVYVEQVLVPTLAPGDIVIMDNLLVLLCHLAPASPYVCHGGSDGRGCGSPAWRGTVCGLS